MTVLTTIRRGLNADGLRVGILGGSFNPAHDGHMHISLLALKTLMLDEVWWMVSPQNPLKSTNDMAPFEDRMASAKNLARHPNIVVTDVERRLGTFYTAETLAKLKTCFPDTRFVWIMGADNLAQMSRWGSWRRIFAQVPIAVYDRAPYSFDALAGKAAQAFARDKVEHRLAFRLPTMAPPAWTFFHTRLHPGSATQIRARRSRLRKDVPAATGACGGGGKPEASAAR